VDLAMGWKETNKIQQKKEFIFKWLGKEESFTRICRDFGIRTKTGYKW
jgi:hypothetical protein